MTSKFVSPLNFNSFHGFSSLPLFTLFFLLLWGYPEPHYGMLNLVTGEKELKIKKKDAALMRNFRVSILSIPFLPARIIRQMSNVYAKMRKLEPQDTW